MKWISIAALVLIAGLSGCAVMDAITGVFGAGDRTPAETEAAVSTLTSFLPAGTGVAVGGAFGAFAASYRASRRRKLAAGRVVAANKADDAAMPVDLAFELLKILGDMKAQREVTANQPTD